MEGAALKILLADDDRVTRRLIQSQLQKWGYEVDVAENGERAWEILASPGGPRLAVLDWMMPLMDGAQVCSRLRTAGTEGYTYVILLTSKSRPEDLAAGLDAGADDYVVKPFDATELRARLKVGERVLGFSEALMKANSLLKTMALTDALTGLLNHGASLTRLEEEHARQGRTGFPLAVLMADIDHFKNFNDTHGHEAGDCVLAAVAQQFRSACRPYDVVGRYGGEEFVVLLPATAAPEALLVAERVRTGVEGAAVPYDGLELRVTVSIGAASLGASSICEAQSLLRAADHALYRAKAAGRNRVCQATPDDWENSTVDQERIAP